MRSMRSDRPVLLKTSLAVFVLVAAALAAGTARYSVAKTYPVGGDGGWDYLTFDTGANRVFISRGTHVVVMDADSGKVLGDIPDTPGVHGIALSPELGRGFISSGRANSVTIFDLKDLHKIGEAKTGEGPDAIAYDPVSKRVFTFNGRGHDTTAIDAASGAVAGSLPLGGKPEFAAADGKGRIYVNIEDKSELVALNTQTLKEEKRWPIKGCEEPSGLAMDREHRRLFAGCGNKVMAVVNADTGDVVATLPIDAGVDANAFDPGTQLAFSSNGSGTLTVVHEDSPDKYTVVHSLETARGARTMALDPNTHRIFLVTAEFGLPPAATAENPRPRPTMVPGSFKVLVAELSGK